MSRTLMILMMLTFPRFGLTSVPPPHKPLDDQKKTQAETMVNSWLKALEQKNFKRYQALHTKNSHCLVFRGHRTRTIKREKCLSVRRRVFAHSQQLALVESSSLNLSTGKAKDTTVSIDTITGEQNSQRRSATPSTWTLLNASWI
jgi:hypothetical protein